MRVFLQATPTMPRYLTLEQVSERMHIRTATARNRLSRGAPMPPSVRVGKRRLFPAAAIERWFTRYLAAGANADGPARR